MLHCVARPGGGWGTTGVLAVVLFVVDGGVVYRVHAITGGVAGCIGSQRVIDNATWRGV